MSALIIIMLWIGLNLTIERFLNKKMESKKKRARKIQRKNYDFDILSFNDEIQLKKSA